MSTKSVPEATWDTGKSLDGVEYRCRDDDAWYAVSLRLEAGGCVGRGGRAPVEEHYMRVMYDYFPEVCDERFWAGAFKDETALEQFSARFRAQSLQLQDEECWAASKGTVVCGAYAYGDTDVRFYDAIVEEVYTSDHETSGENEACTCTFVLLWKHGPNSGRRTNVGVEHIALLRQGVTQIDNSLFLFLEHARNNIKSAGQCGTSVGCNGTPDVSGRTDPGFVCRPSDTNFGHQLDIRDMPSSGRSSSHGQSLGQDVDLGGRYLNNLIHPNVCFCYILIENLEKDLSTRTIVDFIFQETSIYSMAHVFPSLESESYTRGTILVEIKEEADKLLCFLQKPQQIIVSSRGRPWVITEGNIHFETAGLMFKFEKQLPIKGEEVYELKVVYEGSKAFADAVKLQALFAEFHDHFQRLHRRLVSEELKTLQQSA